MIITYGSWDWERLGHGLWRSTANQRRQYWDSCTNGLTWDGGEEKWINKEQVFWKKRVTLLKQQHYSHTELKIWFYDFCRIFNGRTPCGSHWGIKKRNPKREQHGSKPMAKSNLNFQKYVKRASTNLDFLGFWHLTQSPLLICRCLILFGSITLFLSNIYNPKEFSDILMKVKQWNKGIFEKLQEKVWTAICDFKGVLLF